MTRARLGPRTGLHRFDQSPAGYTCRPTQLRLVPAGADERISDLHPRAHDHEAQRIALAESCRARRVARKLEQGRRVYAILALCLIPATALAALLFDDGTLHVINTPNPLG